MMVRIMIAVLLIGSCVLAWLDWQQYQEIQELEAALEPGGRVEQTVEDIQRNAFTYTQYKERAASEGVKGSGDEASIAKYVRGFAQSNDVLWGGVSIGPGKPRPSKVGKKTYIDTTYRIEPQEKGQTFDRRRIANFFHLLERDSRKVKITEIDLRADGKVDAHEIPNDRYDVEFALTVRGRDEKKRR